MLKKINKNHTHTKQTNKKAPNPNQTKNPTPKRYNTILYRILPSVNFVIYYISFVKIEDYYSPSSFPRYIMKARALKLILEYKSNEKEKKKLRHKQQILPVPQHNPNH